MRGALPLLLAALVVASCGLVYELLAATVASWVLGDSVTQFSTVIGGYLGALGLGSFLSRYLGPSLATRFVQLELLVALCGGLTAPALFATFEHAAAFRVALYGSVAATGTLVGLELPLLLRILEAHAPFRDGVARVFAYDHAGSLLGSLLFSLLLLPALGPLRTGLLFGMLNALVALASTAFLRPLLPRVAALRIASVVLLLALAGVLARASSLIAAVEMPR